MRDNRGSGNRQRREAVGGERGRWGRGDGGVSDATVDFLRELHERGQAEAELIAWELEHAGFRTIVQAPRLELRA